MKRDEQQKIRSFIKVCKSLEASKFYTSTDEITIKISELDSQEIPSVNEDNLRSFLLDFRKIILQKEPTEFGRIINILKKNSPKFTKKIESLKQGCNGLIKRRQINLGAPNDKSDIVDIWLNGNYFHSDDSQKKIMVESFSAPDKLLFITSLVEITNYALKLSLIASQIISGKLEQRTKKGKAGIQFNQKLSGNDQIKTIATKLSRIEKTSDLDIESKIRLLLFSSAQIYNKNVTNGEILRSHDLNLAYRYKESISPIYSEAILILRTLISDNDNIIPGWYWFSSLTKKTFLSIVGELFLDDFSNLVRFGSLKIVGDNWTTHYLPILTKFSKDEDSSIRRKVLSIIKPIQNQDSLDIINNLVDDSDEYVRTIALSQKIETLIKINYHEALKFIETINDIDKLSIDNLPKLFLKLNKIELEKYLDHKSKKLKEVANIAYFSRYNVDVDKLQKLLSDSLAEVRLLAINELIKRGFNYSITEVEKIVNIRNSFAFNTQKLNEVLDHLAERKSYSELGEAINWDVGGAKYYFLLGKKFFHNFKNQVRKDLNESFVSSKVMYLERFANIHKLSIEQSQNLLEKYDDFITERFIISALSIILIYGRRSDVVFARKFIESDSAEIRSLSISIISKYGFKRDSSLLLNFALNNQGGVAAGGLLGSLSLYKGGIHKTLRRITEQKNNELANVLIAYCLKHNLKLRIPELKLILRSDNETTRELGVALLDKQVRSYPRKKKILKDYFHDDSGTYYYNVVCWLDRFIFSPKPFLKNYKTYFDNKVENLLTRHNQRILHL